MSATAVRERPIIFDAESVRAILDGLKTVMRRVLKPQPSAGVRASPFVPSGVEDGHGGEIRVPYRPGDHLWVRETHALFPLAPDPVLYRADPGISELMAKWRANPAYPQARWRSPIHMPRWASRLLLEVVDVRPERLHEITHDDAVMEGVRCWICNGPVDGSSENDCGCFHSRQEARPSFELRWNDLNAKRGFPWESNPWVWRIEFRRVDVAALRAQGVRT